MPHNEWAKLISNKGAELGSPMRIEAQMLVFEVAQAAEPRATIKAKKNFVCQQLGYPAGSWRIHDAWHGRASGWSYQAMRDLQAAVHAWRERRANLAREQAAIKAMLVHQSDLKALQAARVDHKRALKMVEARLAALGMLKDGS